jgi:uncharacterized protein (TIGR04255 family)
MTTYPKNFITKVIARVDFQPILKLKEEPVDFQEAIRAEFPRFSRKESVDISIKTGAPPVTSKIPIWLFMNKDKTAIIELNYQFLSLVLNKYDKYDSFQHFVELMYNNFNNIYKPGLIKLIVLRFINQIELSGDPYDWDGYINDMLCCSVKAFPDLPNKLMRAMSQMHIKLGDRKLLFNYGIYNSEYPNIIAQKEFILDYECAYSDESEPEGVLIKFKQLYEDIKAVFKQCRGDKLLKIMKGENV